MINPIVFDHPSLMAFSLIPEFSKNPARCSEKKGHKFPSSTANRIKKALSVLP